MAKSATGVTYMDTGDIDVKGVTDRMLNQLAENIRGMTTFSLAGATTPVTLSVLDAAPEARQPVIRFTGSQTVTKAVLVPLNEALREFTVWNDTTEGGSSTTVTVKTTDGTSTGVTVPRGYVQKIFHDGTHFYPAGPAVHRTTGLLYAAAAPAARVYHNASQSIPNNAWTSLAFNSERHDSFGMHDNATNNSRLTIPATVGAGNFMCGATVQFADNGAGVRSIRLYLNGATIIALSQDAPLSGYVTVIECFTPGPYALAAADYVECQVFQNSGGALNVTVGSNYSPEFGLWRV